MRLCVDVGNSRIKIARVGGGRIGRVVALPSDSAEKELVRAIERAMRGARHVEESVLSSVFPAATARALRAVTRVTGAAPLVVTHRVAMPIALGVRRPARVGTDRLCSACGALAGRRRSALIIDVGSAITVNAVIDRRFLGGVIMAGPSMSLAALHHFTARLPVLDFEGGPVVPSRIDDTEAAMRWGAVLGAAGGIRAASAMLEARAGRRLVTFVTGGHSRRLMPLLPPAWRWQPHLTLLGLAEIGRHHSLRGHN